MRLSIYRNRVIDWVVAESPEDATRVLCEHAGRDFGDVGEDDTAWEPVGAATVLRVFDDDGKRVSRTAADWIRLEGRCFLASTEW